MHQSKDLSAVPARDKMSPRELEEYGEIASGDGTQESDEGQAAAASDQATEPPTESPAEGLPAEGAEVTKEEAPSTASAGGTKQATAERKKQSRR
jgi:hypothetical protein